MGGSGNGDPNVATHYVLIDYENVQPKNLAALKEDAKDRSFRVIVFVGATQAKIPRDLVFEMQSFGSDAEYLEVTGSGKNALDFHIAYYLGKLARPGSDDHFHVVSRDTGFDVLIKHLQSQGINVDRRKGLFEIPWIQVGESDSFGEQVDKVVQNFDLQGKSRPRKVRTVRTTINALFGKSLTDEQLDALVKGLQDRKYIAVEGERIRYKP